MLFAASAVALVLAGAIRIRRKAIRRAKDREKKRGEDFLSPAHSSFPDILISCRIRRYYTWRFLLDPSFRYHGLPFGCTSSRMVPSSSERGGGLDKTVKRRAHFFHHASTGEPMTRQVIILGSGCAGSTAAIYSARANLSPLVLEGHEPGGQLSLTTDVENYPGFPDGIQGPELVDLMKRQAQRFGAEYRMEKVTGVDLAKRPFTVNIEENSYEAQSLIIATGASARMLGLESEKKLLGRGVSTCATCDGAFFRDKDVLVVGGGDTAVEEATFLTKFASKVTIVHRRDQLRASKIMADRALKNKKVEFLWNTVITDILDPGKKEVTGVKIRNTRDGTEETRKADGVFIAIGHDPNTGIFEGQLEMEKGYLVVRDGSRTSVEGVFAAGDVHDFVYRQAVTAAGCGCRAAIDAERWLESRESG